MNKRKIMSLALGLCMVAILAVGGTLAYFTDAEVNVNVMQVGELDIVQKEDFDSETKLVPGGDRIRKEVTVTNEGEVDAYIRTLVAFEDTRDTSVGVHVISGWNEYLDFPEKDNDYLQIQKDGVVYTVGVIKYPKVVPAGEKVDYLLTSVQLKANVDDEWREIVGDGYEVIVMTQAANVGDDKYDAEDTLNTAFGEIDEKSDKAVATWFSKATGEFYDAFDGKYDEGVEMWKPAFEADDPGDLPPLL